ncbi:MAG TPA: alpha/beta fold hydrolase [Paludibacter sp.]|nr:alpha/beta fold hydrolase [Paludibacter sp.]
MKTIVISLIFILFLCTDAISCTIFCFTQDGKTYFCNNEDFSRTDTQIRFNPAKKGKYAWVYFGFSNNWAQGGVNEKGLCWDWVAGGVKNSWKKDETKKTIRGNLSEKIIAECTTVDEAIKYYEEYNEPSFAYARTMLADKFGNSVIIGWKDGKIDIQRNPGNPQVLGYGKDAVGSYFSVNQRAKDVNCSAEALNAAHQEGKYPTRYSNIISLSEGKIFLYADHNYKECVEINYLEQLKNGFQKYKIQDLFKANRKHEGILLSKEMAVVSNGATLYCNTIGDGKPVLFIHGGPGLSHSYFLPYIKNLLQYDCRLILYDQRGNGRSKNTGKDSIGLDLFVDDIESIRKELRHDKIVLFGHSFGAYLAYLYALKYPEHSDALIICDGGPLSNKGFDDYNGNWQKQLEQIDLKTIKSLPGMGKASNDMDDQMLRITANRFYNKDNLAGFLINSRDSSVNNEKIFEIQNKLMPEVASILLNKSTYQNPGIKSLVIHGSEDPIPVWTAKEWANILHAKLEIIAKSNHFPFVENTKEVCRLVDCFLKEK